ncbi:hypothetical protein AC578_913 [Pseudocercospora eumusae]|uniref:Uncharacterized protein n=1 Tax=Pseudocercospora eumusae TaxID=321146 RepID=A0A139HBS9_9PEZI|nr:hypothetical protein AC578_913 [Pseudocercospora eumusae]
MATGMISATTQDVRMKLAVVCSEGLSVGCGSGRHWVFCGSNSGITGNIKPTRFRLDNMTQDSGPDINSAPIPRGNTALMCMGFDPVFKAKKHVETGNIGLPVPSLTENCFFLLCGKRGVSVEKPRQQAVMSSLCERQDGTFEATVALAGTRLFAISRIPNVRGIFSIIFLVCTLGQDELLATAKVNVERAKRSYGHSEASLPMHEHRRTYSSTYEQCHAYRSEDYIAKSTGCDRTFEIVKPDDDSHRRMVVRSL